MATGTKKFMVTVEVELFDRLEASEGQVGTDSLTQHDAEELVRTSLQVTANDGYEDDRVGLEGFQIKKEEPVYSEIANRQRRQSRQSPETSVLLKPGYTFDGHKVVKEEKEPEILASYRQQTGQQPYQEKAGPAKNEWKCPSCGRINWKIDPICDCEREDGRQG